MKLSVVVPCYKSELTLPRLVIEATKELSELVASRVLTDFEIVLVVDGSPDNTASVATALSESHNKVRVIILQRNFGQHAATIAGLRSATGEVIVTMDDDLQHQPNQVLKLIAPLLSGEAEICYARPEIEEHGWLRSIASRSVKKALEWAGVTNASWIGSFRAFRTELREGFDHVNDPSVNLDVLLSWTTTSVVPVLVDMPKRAEGASTYSFRRLLNYASNMVTGYAIAPLKFASALGIMSALLGLVFLAVQVVNYFVSNEEVEGFTTIVALICLFAGAQLFTIGIIGEYLGRIHIRSMQKPMFIEKK